MTVCTHQRKCLLWKNYDLIPFGEETEKPGYAINISNPRNVGATIGRPALTRPCQKIKLSEYGHYVKEAFNEINRRYPVVFVDKYVIMPNHIHVIIRIDTGASFLSDGRPMVAPTLSRVINQFKGAVSKRVGFSIWQKSFYDRIIRNANEYTAYCRYIEENPAGWINDEYYIKEK